MNARAAAFSTANFRPGSVALHIRRGNAHFLLPRPWVRGVVPLHEILPLPRAHPWVIGLTVHDGQPLSVLDLAVCSGTEHRGHGLGVLLGAPDQAACTLVVADGPGRFASVPASARLEPTTRWLLRMQDCPQPTWWLDADRLLVELKE
jgi:hypothetical protein